LHAMTAVLFLVCMEICPLYVALFLQRPACRPAGRPSGWSSPHACLPVCVLLPHIPLSCHTLSAILGCLQVRDYVKDERTATYIYNLGPFFKYYGVSGPCLWGVWNGRQQPRS